MSNMSSISGSQVEPTHSKCDPETSSQRWAGGGLLETEESVTLCNCHMNVALPKTSKRDSRLPNDPSAFPRAVGNSDPAVCHE